jgi:hypothetical protein
MNIFWEELASGLRLDGVGNRRRNRVGSFGLALPATILTFIILTFVGSIEFQIDKKHDRNEKQNESTGGVRRRGGN